MRNRRCTAAISGAIGPGGFVLAFVFLLVAFFSSLTATGLIRSATELVASERFVTHEQAFQLAEGGFHHALAELGTSSLSWNDELVGGDGMAGTADDGVLSFGLVTTLPLGSYTVHVSDNTDELPPDLNDPVTDVDGTIRIDSVGTTLGSQRAVTAWISALFNHAIAAQVNILLRQATALGNIHANQDIEVRQTSELLNCSQATAAGAFVIPQGETLTRACGDLVGGDDPILFLRPDEAALRQAVVRWNPPNWTGTIQLFDRETVGYDIPLDVVPNTPQTVQLNGAATLVMFDGHSIRFRQSLGTFRTRRGTTTCVVPINLNVIALEGSIVFEQPICLRGLLWADGDILIAQDSTISGAIVSTGGSIDVRQSSSVTFNRSAFDQQLLTGFGGLSVLSWQEQ